MSCTTIGSEVYKPVRSLGGPLVSALTVCVYIYMTLFCHCTLVPYTNVHPWLNLTVIDIYKDHCLAVVAFQFSVYFMICVIVVTIFSLLTL